MSHDKQFQGSNKVYNKLGKGRSTNSTMIAINQDPDILEKRRLRFAKEAKKNDEDYGLTSRGEDDRLQRDPSARESYFNKIQQEFLENSSALDTDQLRSLFAKLSLHETESNFISKTLLSLRKLREALLKYPPDEFTKRVFLFSVRVSSRIGHYQTYVPSITYLLRHSSILDAQELSSIAAIYALHLSHSNNDNQMATRISRQYAPQDLKLNRILHAWRTCDYWNWFKYYREESDAAKHRVMKFGEEVMTMNAVKIISKTYFQLSRAYLEEIFKRDFSSLKEHYKLTWNCKENNVVIIRPRN